MVMYPLGMFKVENRPCFGAILRIVLKVILADPKPFCTLTSPIFTVFASCFCLEWIMHCQG